jgi:outer membrane protein OmpU
MKTIMKTALVVLSTVALNSIAYAGALSVSGGATARYAAVSGTAQSLDKGMGLTNEFSLGASGELDNGMSWNYAMDIDPGAAGNLAYDDAQLTVTSEMGTIGWYMSEGSLGTKYAWSPSAYGPASDTGDGHGMIYAGNISSYDNIQYHLPEGMLPAGVTLKAAYSPTGSASYSSGGTPTINHSVHDATQVQLTVAPIDGLKVSADYMTSSSPTSVTQDAEDGSVGVKYSMGAVSVGYGQSYKSLALANATDGYAAAVDTALAGYESIENTSYGIGFAVNEDLSLSYTIEQSKPDAMTAATTTYEMEIQSIQASYTMGGMSVSLSRDEVDNADYVNATEQNETLIAVSMAF